MLHASLLNPSDIGLILSYQCQCSCAHCLYNCGPGWDEWMEPDAVCAALGATLSWQHPVQVHITGGEPFLNFPLLRHAVETAHSLRIPCYVETNAGWCVREELAEKRFRELEQAGLSAVLVSCSPFHAEKVPPARTRLAIAKAMEVFGPDRVMIYLPEWLEQVSRFGLDHPTPLEDYVASYGPGMAGRLFWEGYGLIAGGRSGYRLGQYASRKTAEAFSGTTCRTEILHASHSHFDLYGNFISGFCGGLSVGSWRALPQVIADFHAGHYPPLVKILIQGGPYMLYQFARQEYGYTAPPDGFAGKCHLCVDVRRFLSRTEKFDELAPQKFYEMG